MRSTDPSNKKRIIRSCGHMIHSLTLVSVPGVSNSTVKYKSADVCLWLPESTNFCFVWQVF